MDGFLSYCDAIACEAHLGECSVCAAYDVRIRRSLMALQALPVIEPSRDFRAKLAVRLQRERVGATASPVMATWMEGAGIGGTGASVARWVLAGALLAASVAALMLASASRDSISPAAPAMASVSQPVRAPAQQTELVSPAVVAAAVSASAGTSVKSPSNGPLRASVRATPRFEALPGTLPGVLPPSDGRGSGVRLQTVTYIGQ